MIEILDCTLRDGGYIVDGNFGDARINGIIQKLSDAKIDVIEIGFLKNTPHTKGSSIFENINEITPYIPSNSQSSFVAMIDYDRYSLEKLSQKQNGLIDGIRNCFFKKDFRAAIQSSTLIASKGYNVYIQPVDILSYSDSEILELIQLTNEIKPYAFSIVDTFGSMYIDDLVKLFEIIDTHLNKDIKLGFHSHNNLQLSFALAQKLIEISTNKRDVIIDTTMCGLGRGSGNTNTELLVDFLNKKHNAKYDLNKLLDLIDIYMLDIIEKYKWGYSIPYFIAGIHGSHVNNINYLLDKHNLTSKDLRLIIEAVEQDKIKRYDYDNLEKVHNKHFHTNFDDHKHLQQLQALFQKRDILLISPGSTIESYKEEILKYVQEHSPIVISINFTPLFHIDYFFYSNAKKYHIDATKLAHENLIRTSNINASNDDNGFIINYENLVKPNWKFSDNSTIMILRLLNKLNINTVSIAGFDGFASEQNYASNFKEIPYENLARNNELNESISSMLLDFKKECNYKLNFITPSIFNYIFQGE